MRKWGWFTKLIGRKRHRAVPGGSWFEPHPLDAYRKHRDLGLKALAAGQTTQALEALGRAVYLRPDLAEAHLNMGGALQRAGRIEAARQAYLRAQDLKPRDTAVRSLLLDLPPLPPGRDDFRVGQVLKSRSTDLTWEVLEVKKGGFGAVYIVVDSEFGGIFALKTFQAKYLWSDEDRQRFEREALTWVMLERHPNIVAANWVDLIEGFPCLVLDYVSGSDLECLLRRGPFRSLYALELAFQFCDGMAYAHGKLGIVHRDVKPSNCLVAKDGTLKITDFGLSRPFGQVQERCLGVSELRPEIKFLYTTPMGTLQYMAPEQFRAASMLDTRTDIYAFGIMLYKMLTADLPPVGPMALPHIWENAPAYGMKKALKRVILQCVEPEAANRPKGFEEVRQMLELTYRSLVGRAAPAPAKPAPMDFETWMSKGLALLALGHFEKALPCFEQGLKIDPRNVGLWSCKGSALGGLGRTEDELACYEKVLKIDPHHASVWIKKGNTLCGLHLVDEALVCYERSLEINPHNSTLWNNKGLALRDLGRTEEALTCYELGLEIDPRDVLLWANKGATLRQLGRIEEALVCYDHALQIEPRRVRLWANKGTALSYLGRYDVALACYDRGLEVNPRETLLWLNKGGVLHKLHRFADAVTCYDHGLEIDPRDANLWTSKGAALGCMDRHEDALACYDRGLEIDPSGAVLWLNKGLVLYHLDCFEEALACFDQGLQMGPGDANLWSAKGSTLKVLGRAQEADECFQRARELKTP